MSVAIQMIGFLGGAIANLIPFQLKKHRHILPFRTTNEALFILRCFLLGALSGAYLNIVGCGRNMIFSKRVEAGKSTTVFIVLFFALFTTLGILTVDDIKSILLIFAKVLLTIACGNKNTTVIRMVSFSTHIDDLFYNISVFSLAGALPDMFLLISLVIAIVRFDIRPRIKK